MPLLDTAGLPRAHLRTVLLLLLSAASSHGYDLLEEARHLGLRTAEAAGVYRTLRILEHEDLVTSWWEPSQSGPARRTYSITPAGELALAEGIQDLEGLRRALNHVLTNYRNLNRDT